MNVYVIASGKQSYKVEAASLEGAMGIFKLTNPQLPVDALNLVGGMVAQAATSIKQDDTLLSSVAVATSQALDVTPL